MAEGYQALISIALIVLIVLAILWFFLPFAVFGMKPRVDEAIEQAKLANQKLDLLLQELQEQRHMQPRLPRADTNPPAPTNDPDGIIRKS